MTAAPDDCRIMKTLVLTDYNVFELQDWPVPAFGPEDVLIRVAACGICGSDVHGMDGSTGRRQPPIIMGHEAAGIIAEVGAKVARLGRGDRVTFDSTIYCGAVLVLPPRRDQPLRPSPRAGRLVRRLPPARGVRRVRGRAAAHPLPAARCRELPTGRHGRAALGHRLSRRAAAAGVTRDDTAVVVGAGMIGLLVVADVAGGRLRADHRRRPGPGTARSGPPIGRRRSDSCRSDRRGRPRCCDGPKAAGPTSCWRRSACRPTVQAAVACSRARAAR